MGYDLKSLATHYGLVPNAARFTDFGAGGPRKGLLQGSKGSFRLHFGKEYVMNDGFFHRKHPAHKDTLGPSGRCWQVLVGPCQQNVQQACEAALGRP